MFYAPVTTQPRNPRGRSAYSSAGMRDVNGEEKWKRTRPAAKFYEYCSTAPQSKQNARENCKAVAAPLRGVAGLGRARLIPIYRDQLRYARFLHGHPV